MKEKEKLYVFSGFLTKLSRQWRTWSFVTCCLTSTLPHVLHQLSPSYHQPYKENGLPELRLIDWLVRVLRSIGNISADQSFEVQSPRVAFVPFKEFNDFVWEQCTIIKIQDLLMFSNHQRKVMKCHLKTWIRDDRGGGQTPSTPSNPHWDYSLSLKMALRFFYMPAKFIWRQGTEC